MRRGTAPAEFEAAPARSAFNLVHALTYAGLIAGGRAYAVRLIPALVAMLGLAWGAWLLG